MVFHDAEDKLFDQLKAARTLDSPGVAAAWSVKAIGEGIALYGFAP